MGCAKVPLSKPDQTLELTNLLKSIGIYEAVKHESEKDVGTHLKKVILLCKGCNDESKMKILLLNRDETRRMLKAQFGSSWKCTTCNKKRVPRHKWSENDCCYSCDSSFHRYSGCMTVNCPNSECNSSWCAHC